MSDKIRDKRVEFSIHNPEHYDEICRVSHALSNKDRLNILRLIQYKPRSLFEICNALNLPKSSVSNHLQILADAELIFINYRPGLKGHTKICSKAALKISYNFEDFIESKAAEPISFEMPVGEFSDCHIIAPCGLATTERIIETVDEPKSFFLPERKNAEVIWFTDGWVSYKFPNYDLIDDKYTKISFTLEICSEAVYYCNDWPSDITFYVNDVELLTFTSPGDFGGTPGKYTPSWFINGTQFGLLVGISITNDGLYFNDVLYDKAKTFNSFNFKKLDYIKFTIGIKENAIHKGGINIFGKNWGNYNQSIIMTFDN